MSAKDNKAVFDRYLLALRKTSVDEKSFILIFFTSLTR